MRTFIHFILFMTSLISLVAQAGISGSSGLSLKPGYVAEEICEHGEPATNYFCRTVIYKKVEARDGGVEHEPVCLGQTQEDQCLPYFEYPSGS